MAAYMMGNETLDAGLEGSLPLALQRSSSNVYYVTLVAALVSIAVYKSVSSRSKLPPGPTPLPFLGNILNLGNVFYLRVMEWAQKYGPIISFRFGNTLTMVVSSPDLAREVLKENDLLLAARPRTPAIASYSKNGQDLMWADYGPHYVKVRKFCTLELFTPKRLEASQPVRQEETGITVNAIYKEIVENPGSSVHLRQFVKATAFNNISRFVFGKKFVDENGVVDAQGKEFKEIIAEAERLTSSYKIITEYLTWTRWMFPSQQEGYARNGKRSTALVTAIMQEFAVKSRDDPKNASNQDLLNALLKSQKEYDLSEETVLSLLWDMIVAGKDTIPTTVEWAMAELIRNPDVQKKAQDELDSMVGNERIMTELDFARLPYLQALTKEVLRLHPPIPMMIPHEASESVKVGGYDVPKGTTMLVHAYAIGRDPTIWQNPSTFRPERFLEEDIGIKGTDFRVIPFGSGRRVCPGAQLGINIVQLMLGRLLHQFSWSPCEGMSPEQIDMTPRPGLTVRYMATPLAASVSPRLSPSLYKLREEVQEEIITLYSGFR